MKQILTRAAALALACALMLPLSACGGGTEPPADNTPVAVATPTPTSRAWPSPALSHKMPAIFLPFSSRSLGHLIRHCTP